MAQQTNNLRERLLAALPQPENLAAYREETAAFMWLWLQNYWHLDAAVLLRVQLIGAVMFLCAGIASVHYKIYASQIATLKEVKQIQLQVLELQASLGKAPENQP